MPHITINDANYYYELHGKGSPLVLISGYGGIGQSWMPLVEHLKQDFQVLIFDNRAVGQTVDNEANLTAELIADDVITMCNELKTRIRDKELI